MIKMIVKSIEVEFMAFEISERAEFRQFEMVKGDTLPNVSVKFMSNPDEALNIIPYEIHFFLMKADEMDTVINDGHTLCFKTNALLGEAEYRWAVGDTSRDGIHYGEFALIGQDGKRQTIKDRIRFLFM